MSTLLDFYNKSSAKSISDKTCESLRAAIINHYFLTGERLVESKIAKNLNVSITPVRYAFTQLSKEGLIDSIPYRGTYVKKLDRKFIAEATETRMILELRAAEQAFENITRDDMNRMLTLARILDQAIGSGASLYEISVADMLFHEIFFEKSHNDLLYELWLLIKPRLQLITSYNKIRIPSVMRLSRHMILLDSIRDNAKQTFLNNLKEHCKLLIDDFNE